MMKIVRDTYESYLGLMALNDAHVHVRDRAHEDEF